MFSEEFNNNSNDCIEENLECVNAADSDMTEDHIETIFDDCDVENSGYLCVSTLLEFMEPFLQENLNELNTIKSLLDPIGDDPKIDKNRFCSEMRKWAESHRKIEESNSLQTTPRHSNSNTSSPFSKFLQCSFEENLKTTYSCGSTPSPLTHHNFEKSLEIQEEIDSLKQQNRKLNNDLQDSRTQLLLSEECNTNLQVDISRITKRLEAEQQANQNLQKFKLECEELRESEMSLKRDQERLINNNNNLRTENTQLNEDFETLQNEKIKLCEEIEQYRAKNKENNRLLSEARYKIDNLKEQLSSKEDSMRDVEEKFNTFQEKITDYENTIAFLRAEKEKCKTTPKSEKSFKENIDYSQNLRLIDANMNIDHNNATINTSYPFLIQDEVFRDVSSSSDTLYSSLAFDSKILQNNSLLNELKEVTTVEEIDNHIKCSNKINCLEGELNTLKEEYDASLRTLNSKDTIIKKYETQSNELDVIIKNLKSDLKNIKKSLTENSERIHVQEHLIREKDAIICELQNKIQNLININNNLKHEKEQLIEEKIHYEKKIDGMKGKYEEKIHYLQGNLHEVEMNIKCLSEDSKKYKNLKSKLETISNDLNHVIQKYEGFKQCSFDQKSIEENFENIIQNFKLVLINLKNNYDELCLQIIKLNDNLDEKSKTIEYLNNLILNTNQIVEENRSFKIQLEQKENELIQQSDLLNEQNNEIEQLKNTLEDFENMTKELERLNKIEREHNHCPNYMEKIESLQNQCYQQQIEIENFFKNESCKNEVELLTFENNKLKSDYEKMLNSLQNKNYELQTKFQYEHEEKEKMQEKVVSITCSLEDLKNEIEVLIKYRKDLQFQLNELQTKNDQLNIDKKGITQLEFQSLRDCNEIEFINTQLQETLTYPTSSINIIESTSCRQCMQLQSKVSNYEIICANQQQQLYHFQTEYQELNPRPDIPRLKQNWTKTNPTKRLPRLIEKLQHQLELEITKNEELCNHLEKIKGEKSHLESQLAQNDCIVTYQEEIDKFKSYLEEIANYLNNMTRQVCSKSASTDIFIDWEEDINIIPLKKERYYETYYYNFNRNLNRYVFILMNKDKITKQTSHKSTQISPNSVCDGSSYDRTLSSIQKSQPITLQPSKLFHHSNYDQHPSASPTPKLKSKFGFRSRSPEIDRGFVENFEQQKMAEPCSFESPKLDVQMNKTIIEMNNNVSPDSPASLVFSTVSINQNNQNETNVLPSSSHAESKVESTTSNDVSGPVNVPDVVHEVRHENWSSIMRRFSNMSISASSANSGSTESLSIDNEHTLQEEDRHNYKIALDIAIPKRNNELKQNSQTSPSVDNEKSTTDTVRERSKSQSSHSEELEQIELFPSIPDTFLQDLNLQTKPEEESKEDLCEQDEIEKKFMALSLAFLTDGTTLTTRRERLQKFRDQAEQNLLNEVEQLMVAIHKLNPLCIDAERTELVTSLISQVDVLKKAAKQSWNMSQCFGAVQQEWRLNESVKLMLKYVESVKLQRDTARRHFQYTRRMLQESTSAETPKTSAQPKTVLSNSNSSSNSRLMTRRRASIATISRPTTPTESLRTLANRRPSPSLTDPIVRRLELPDRLSPAVIRSTRQSRSELGVAVEQLQNIHENMEAESSEVSDYESSEISSKTTNRLNNSENSHIIDTCTPNPYALMVCNFFRRYCGDSLHSSGLLHEICVTGALVFFFIAAMQLGSVLLEVEYARHGVTVNRIPWSWAKWDELIEALFNWNSSDDNGPRPY